MSFKIRKLLKSEYPFQLQQISQLPESMEIAGSLPGPENKFLCVVGSRNHDSYAEDACKKIITGLKGYPIVIVSGLAIGIDSLAHECALQIGLTTIAFPGSGLAHDVLYPSSRRRLAHRIVENSGALISPFPTNQPSTLWTFPVRNRLMAGISHATLIIQGNKNSGTLLTAGHAVEFSRSVLAVPGSIFSELSYGPHSLIRDGAAPIMNSIDVLHALDFQVTDNSKPSFRNIAELALSPEEKRIIAELRFSPQPENILMENTCLPSSSFNILASKLELLGIIKEDGGIFRMNV